MYLMSLTIIFAPLVGALVLLFSRDLTEHYSSIIANVSVGISALVSLVLLIPYLSGNGTSEEYFLYTWYLTGDYHFQLGFLVDSLTAIMAFIVSFISFFVHVYSITYMQKDISFKRFFIYTNFFTFSMLVIIFSNNFLQLFIGWELVGLSSYLLIGFWHKKESAIKANLKAFVVNRIGDIGLLLGVLLVFISTKSLSYNILFNNLALLTDEVVILFNYDFEIIPLIAVLLFIGAAAKSAQVPLHFWLPDSMEGPTPISALIHAATMVTAGIFMVARLSPLYDLSFYVLDIILITGLITAFFMGIVALVQNDIKRIIAYSTISQLGYMTVALGASFYSFAIFHLLTHAFFKALLFLCAGSIILKCHHEQNINKMGGLRFSMPITFLTFTVAGLSLIGFPGMSGFFSKDLIIDIFKYNNNYIIYYILVASIVVTTLYTSKIFFKVFFGTNKLKVQKSDGLEHNKTLLVPLIILAAPSAIIGWALFDTLIFNNFFLDSITDDSTLNYFYQNYIIHSVNFFLHSFSSLSFLALLIGLLLSYFHYYKKNTVSHNFLVKIPVIKNILLNEYGFNHLSNFVIPNNIKKISDFLWKKADISLIDNTFVNGSANIVSLISNKIRLLQTGYIYHYAFIMIIGLLFFLIIFYDF
ncbi:MAG: NADH-quinone oxidoreductase subunit L [Gammaproteobacteria bacterium]|nr:NADH-quinone oxidoreductase subunit L [Gammaproteobacteria bacterium]